MTDTVRLEARSERSGEGKERRATVGLEATSERSGEGNERRARGEAEGTGAGLSPNGSPLRSVCPKDVPSIEPSSYDS